MIRPDATTDPSYGNRRCRTKRRSLWASFAPPIFFLCMLHLFDDAPVKTSAWQEWKYSKNVSKAWQELWLWDEGPHGRRGHSMVLAGTKIILFGGRDNEKMRNHIPRSYEIKDVNGSLQFESYDRRYVVPCKKYNVSDPSTYAPGVDETTECVNVIPTGGYFNDVWSYELNCSRIEDYSCDDRSWEVLHIGAEEGDCEIILGREICTVPTERWLHGAAMYNDSTMLIYGGFSQRCEDYCDDMWSFDLEDFENPWMEIYPIGFFSDGESPGRRWKFSVIFDGEWMMFFGGFRVWHGFAEDNSWENRWDSFDEFPEGGYMDDIWVYTKRLLDPGELVPTNNVGYGQWEKRGMLEECYSSPGETWADRNERTCSGVWPKPRAGHAATYDKTRGYMWIHGGFTSYYPYIKTGFRGAGPGVTPAADPGFSPYPNHPFYLDDMWFYNISSGFWTEVKPVSIARPYARVDHIMEISGHVIFMFGGYSNNHLYDDTWQYNITSNRWFEKKNHPHALYPENCTDDWKERILNPEYECFELESPLDLERQEYRGPESVGYDPLPFHRQAFYTPSRERVAWYFGIIDENEPIPMDGTDNRDRLIEVSRPMVPYAASAPYQFVRLINDTTANATLMNGTVYVRCTSVKGEPTRDRVTDGMYGRANESILIPVPRRQSPGWDGCRDRADMRHLVDAGWVNELQFLRPAQRADHKSIYIDSLAMGGARAPQEPHASGGRLGEIYIFGGSSFTEEKLPITTDTFPSVVRDDFWRLGVHECLNNCSNHGVCEYGFCYCYDGYYGMDCSNQSCPGDYCYWDELKHEQVCHHCCYAGFSHEDSQTWNDGVIVNKVPCSNEYPGESNGVCDGYGHCQCAPPFIGDDCSIRDCEKGDNGYICSDNGYCSVEFPISRCVCNPGYYGETCQYRICLNNCSYPKGECDPLTGECACHPVMNPYDNSMPFEFKRVYHDDYPDRYSWETVHWGGEDCSFIMAYAAASGLSPNFVLLGLGLLPMVVSWFATMGDFGWRSPFSALSA